MRHKPSQYLQARLDKLRALLPANQVPPIVACWADLAAGSATNNTHTDLWAQAVWTRSTSRQPGTAGGRFIGISRRLLQLRAPAYVIDYLLGHELLHFTAGTMPRASATKEDTPGRASACPGYRVIWHHAAFRTAEALLPRARQAQAWLDSHTK